MQLHTAGAKRGLLNVRDEEVGLVGLHWEDRFFEFVPQNGEVRWVVQPWGSWQVGSNHCLPYTWLNLTVLLHNGNAGKAPKQFPCLLSR